LSDQPCQAISGAPQRSKHCASSERYFCRTVKSDSASGQDAVRIFFSRSVEKKGFLETFVRRVRGNSHFCVQLN
jgi:hypothetical protein